MLDELRELDLFTREPGQQMPTMIRHLLPYDKKRKAFRGFPRALELVARHRLFAEGAGPEQAAARADEAMAALEDWCNVWMERAIEARCQQEGFSKTEALQAWDGQRARFAKPMFAPERLWASNFNATCFQQTLARAFRKGPLKRWCLAGRLAPDEACRNFNPSKGRAGKLNRTNAPTVIGLTALCLRGLGQEGQVPRTGFVPVNLQELASWMMRDKEFERSTIERWLFEDEPLFTQSEEQAGVKSWKVSQTWLDAGAWQLLDITQGTETLAQFRAAHAGGGFACYQDGAYDQPGFEADPFKTLTCTPMEQVIE